MRTDAYAARWEARFDGGPVVKMAACGECPKGECDGCRMCDSMVELLAYVRGAPPPSRSCPHRDSWFDRTLCAIDDWMHTRCRDCGAPLDGDCGATSGPLRLSLRTRP